MLKTDKEAVDRAIDRCEAGGTDNRRGIRFDRDKAGRQVRDYAVTFVRDATERAEILAYFERQADAITDAEVAR